MRLWLSIVLMALVLCLTIGSGVALLALGDWLFEREYYILAFLSVIVGLPMLLGTTVYVFISHSEYIGEQLGAPFARK